MSVSGVAFTHFKEISTQRTRTAIITYQQSSFKGHFLKCPPGKPFDSALNSEMRQNCRISTEHGGERLVSTHWHWHCRGTAGRMVILQGAAGNAQAH
jgi:hypothetical protein